MKKLIAAVAIATIIGSGAAQNITVKKTGYSLEVYTIAESLPSMMQLEAIEEMQEKTKTEIIFRDAHEQAEGTTIAAAPTMILRDNGGNIIKEQVGYLPAQMLESWLDGK